MQVTKTNYNPSKIIPASKEARLVKSDKARGKRRFIKEILKNRHTRGYSK